MKMKKFGFYIFLCSLLALASCEHDEMSVTKIAGDGFTLTGNSTIGTKTSFGTPESGSIPFLWEAGDCIYVNGFTSEALNEGGTTAEFIFTEGSVNAGDAVYFGAVDFEINPEHCMVLACPWQDGDSKDLSYNSEFGYAIVGEDNSFTLQHYSSYLWLNTYSQEVTKKVAKVTISAQNDIVGWCEFDEELRKFVGTVSPMIPAEDVDEPGEEILAQTKSIVMEFQDKENDYIPAPKQLLVASSDDEIWAVAVTLPVTTGSLRIDYEFEDGTCASYSYPAKTLAAGTTYKITQEIKAADLYKLRILTFEDEDVKFLPYNLEYCSAEISNWSDLVAADQYMDGLIYSFDQSEGDYYNWNDKENTFLAHHFPCNYGTYAYWGGGHAISNYVSSDYETYGDYMSQLTVYNIDASKELSQENGGHNNSNNFCMHFGYIDGSRFNQTDELSSIYFSDGNSRVIDHLWVANNTYAINCFINGNGLTEEMGDDDVFYVTASGYDENENFVGTTSINLAKGKNYLSKWTKWDLSSLGKVASVQFNVCGTSDNGYGFSQPAYFAYDDVAVRFSVGE